MRRESEPFVTLLSEIEMQPPHRSTHNGGTWRAPPPARRRVGRRRCARASRVASRPSSVVSALFSLLSPRTPVTSYDTTVVRHLQVSYGGPPNPVTPPTSHVSLSHLSLSTRPHAHLGTRPWLTPSLGPTDEDRVFTRGVASRPKPPLLLLSSASPAARGGSAAAATVHGRLACRESTARSSRGTLPALMGVMIRGPNLGQAVLVRVRVRVRVRV